MVLMLLLPSGDLSREGPFDAYCAPLDTGDHPLVSNGLPGCHYCMTSYAGTDTADVIRCMAFSCTTPVSRVHRGSGVGSLAEQVTSLLDPDYGSDCIRTMDRIVLAG